MTKEQPNKPIIESAINGAALVIISYGVTQITTGTATGYLAIVFGVALEWFKYWGRRKYW